MSTFQSKRTSSLADPELGVSVDALDVGDGGDLVLDRLDDLAQALQRMAAGERHLDVDLGLVDDRHEVQRQQEEGHRAQHDQAEEQHQRRHRTVEGNVGQPHDCASEFGISNFEFRISNSHSRSDSSWLDPDLPGEFVTEEVSEF